MVDLPFLTQNGGEEEQMATCQSVPLALCLSVNLTSRSGRCPFASQTKLVHGVVGGYPIRTYQHMKRRVHMPYKLARLQRASCCAQLIPPKQAEMTTRPSLPLALAPLPGPPNPLCRQIKSRVPDKPTGPKADSIAKHIRQRHCNAPHCAV